MRLIAGKDPARFLAIVQRRERPDPARHLGTPSPPPEQADRHKGLPARHHDNNQDQNRDVLLVPDAPALEVLAPLQRLHGLPSLPALPSWRADPEISYSGG